MKAEKAEDPNEECVICNEKFINITPNNYYNWLDTMEKKYPFISSSLENNTSGRLFNNSFHCGTCNTMVCLDCTWKTRQGLVCAKVSGDGEGGSRPLTDEEIKLINTKLGNYYCPEEEKIQYIIDTDNQNEIDNIPDIRMNNKRYYSFCRGQPGEDGPIKCPVCRQNQDTFN